MQSQENGLVRDKQPTQHTVMSLRYLPEALQCNLGMIQAGSIVLPQTKTTFIFRLFLNI